MGRAPDGAVGPRRMGMFGGTFDPPHNGHISAARDVAAALDLDEVLWVPAGEPPHRASAELTPASIRLEMVKAAAAVDPCFRLIDLELKRAGPSYTVDTLRELRTGEGAGDLDLFLIIGIDQYHVFDSWRDPDEILELAHLVVMDRSGESVASTRSPEAMSRGEGSRGDGNRYGRDRVLSVPVRRIDISSTEVRARVRDGRDVSALVPSAVASIMKVEGLYRS